MTIKETLENSTFPLPAIREVNMAKHASSISLGLGELSTFPVDDAIINSITNCDVNTAFNYTANAGLPLLRTTIAEAQKNYDAYAYTMDNVVVTIGVQNAIYTAIKTLSNLGAQRVLIPAINFGIYKKIPNEFNMEVACYALTDDFGIDLDQLSKQLKPNDILIINSPSNPTGRVFSDKEMQALGDLLTEKLSEGYVISDEIYGQLIYGEERFNSFSKYFTNTIIANGVSKSGAVAGLRVGWLLTKDVQLAKAFTSNNATIISCPPTLNQIASVPVVSGKTSESIKRYNQQLKINCELVCKVLTELDIPFIKPKGSFYIFPDVRSVIGTDTKTFCIATAKQKNGVVVIPGEAFGAPGYIRISLASADIAEGMERLKSALKSADK